MVLRILFPLLLSPRTSLAQETAPDLGGDDVGESEDADLPVIRVIAAGAVPFVIPPRDDKPDGLAVDVFEMAAAPLGWRTEWTYTRSVVEAMDAVAAGEADIAVGPISITAARAENVEFTQPWYQAAQGILAHAGDSLFDRIKPFMTRSFLTGVGALLMVLLMVGTILWLAERQVNEAFDDGPQEGIPNGIWLALVTMTTVGYGDLAPQTRVGKLVTGVWMLLAMVVASSLTAFIATALTLSQLEAPQVATAEDMVKRPIGVVRDTVSVDWVRDQRGKAKVFPSLPEAVAALEAGKLDAVVFDRPTLRYHLKQMPDSELTLSESVYKPQGYGFALAHQSPLRAPLDVQLLRLAGRGEIEALAREYLD